MSHIEYSIIVPVFNSEATLVALFNRLRLVFDNIGKPFEIIFVEDSGQDSSWELIKTIYKQYPYLVYAIRLSRNFGQHAATLCGMQVARGNFIISIDDDLQFSPEEIPKLIARQTQSNADCVYGTYQESHQVWLRKLGSLLMQWVMRLTFKSQVDVSPFRLLKNSLVQKVRQHSQGYLFLDGLIWWHTHDVVSVNVVRQKRVYGKSGYNIRSLVRLMLHLIFNYTLLPLQLMLASALFMLVVSFVFYMGYINLSSLFKIAISNAIIGSIWFVAAILAIYLVIIMAYMVRIYAIQQKMPTYSVKEALVPMGDVRI